MNTRCLLSIMLLINLLVPFISHAQSPDTIELNLTYTEDKGASGPSSGSGDFVHNIQIATIGTAAMLHSFGNLGSMLNDIFSGKEVILPKTTGETMRQYMSSQLSSEAAKIPRNSGFRGRIQATLEWDKNKKAYFVKKGTLTWNAFNNSNWQADGHEQFCNLKVQGTHKLKPEEIKITYSEGKFSETIGPKARSDKEATYNLELSINPKASPVTGTAGWIVGNGGVYETKEYYTEKNLKRTYTDEYKPTKGGNDFAATSHRGEIKEPPMMYSHPVNYKAEERTITEGTASFKEDWQDPLGTTVAIKWSVDLPDTVTSDPGGPYEVERAEKVMLDASHSKGQIKEYEWTFESMGDERGRGKGRKTKKKGEQVTIQPLSNVKITLKVKGRKSQDISETMLTVTPRDFKTRIDIQKTDFFPIPLSEKESYVRGLSILPVAKDKTAAGFNMCGEETIKKLSEWEKINHYIHIDDKQADKGLEQAFVLDYIQDKNGPDDGKWYIKEIKFKIKPKGYISPYYNPVTTAPFPFGASNNWYNENVQKRDQEEKNIKDGTRYEKLNAGDYNPSAFYIALVQHEEAHGELLKEAFDIEKNNPGLQLEKLIDEDHLKIEKDAKTIMENAVTLCSKTGKSLDDGNISISGIRSIDLHFGKMLVFDTISGRWIDGASQPTFGMERLKSK